LIVRLKAARFHGGAWRCVASLWTNVPHAYRNARVRRRLAAAPFFSNCGAAAPLKMTFDEKLEYLSLFLNRSGEPLRHPKPSLNIRAR
jgi:hypothetical protein